MQSLEHDREQKLSKAREQHTPEIINPTNVEVPVQASTLLEALPPEPVEGLVVQVKLPNGQKVSRKFSKDNKVFLLFDWIRCVNLIHSNITYTIPAVFDLVTTHPRVSLKAIRDQPLNLENKTTLLLVVEDE